MEKRVAYTRFFHKNIKTRWSFWMFLSCS